MELAQSPDGALALRLGAVALVARGTRTAGPFVAASPLVCLALLPPATAAAAAAATDGLPSVVVACDDKSVSVLAPTAGGALAVQHAARLGKKPSAMALLPLGGGAGGGFVAVLGDKAGDCLALALPDVSAQRRALLGHTATIVTALEALQLAGRDFLVSGDRDECIRVSHFPATHAIQSVCRGHTRFVSALRALPCGVRAGDEPDRPLVPAAAAAGAAAASAGYAPGELLVSGGGDGTLRLWHVATGTLLHTLYLQQQPGSSSLSSSSSSSSGGGGGDGGPGRSRSSALLPAGTLLSPPVNSGPPPAGAVCDVVTGAFGCYGSLGPHVDPSMNFSTMGGEGGEDAEGGDEGGGDEPADGAHAAAAAAAAAAPVSHQPVPPHAFLDRESHSAHLQCVLHSSPPVYPVALAAAPPSVAAGLLAVVLEGEHAVRFVRVCMQQQPTRLPPAPGHAVDGGSLPQARLVQVGVMPLPYAPRIAAFAAPASAHAGVAAAADAPPPVLLVGGGAAAALPAAAAAGGCAYRLHAYSVEEAEQGDGFLSLLGPLALPLTSPAGGDEAEGGERGGAGGGASPSFAAAYGLLLQGVAALNTALDALPAGAVGAASPVHFITERLSDYDKFVAAAADAAHKAARAAAKLQLGAAGALAAAAAAAAPTLAVPVEGGPPGKRARVE